MIEVEALTKHFRIHNRPAGLAAAFRSIFHRTYETVKAVEQINFTIQAGERIGFLGPNGAGKTTTLKMLAGLLFPTSGKILVDGHVPQKRSVEFLRKIMLVMGQKQQLIWDLPPVDTFDLNRAIYDVDRVEFKRRIDELVTLLKIEEVVFKPTRQLSLGERMKCELAAALVHGPKVLFLDEPTIGLDVTMQLSMREFIRRYNEVHKATLILTSHYMDDVAALCPRIVVIDKGALTFDGSLKSLVQKVRPEKRIALRFASVVERSQLERFGTIVSWQPGEVALGVPESEVNHVIQKVLSALPVKDLTVENAPLEEVMRELFSNTEKTKARLSA